MNEEYVLELYNYISGADQTFQNDISQDQFVSDMADKQYAAQIYQYIGGLDETFKNDVDIKQFLIDIGVNQVVEEPLDPAVKKKDDSESPSVVGSSDLPEIDSVTRAEFNKIKPLITTGFDPDNYQPQDTRDDGYKDPVRMLGMYPEGGSDAVDEAFFKQMQDIEYTASKIREEEPELLATQATEAASRKSKGEEAIARNEEAKADKLFIEALNKTDKASIDLEEDDAVSYFNDLYGKFGLSFRPIGMGDAMEGSVKLPNGDIKKIERKLAVIENNPGYL